MHVTRSKQQATQGCGISYRGLVKGFVQQLFCEVSHSSRALLALMLEESYEGELPLREAIFKFPLRDMLDAREVWWTYYISKVALILRPLYSSSFVDKAKLRVQLLARCATNFAD